MLARLVWTLLSRRRAPGWQSDLAAIERVAAMDRPTFEAWQAEALARHLAWAASTVPYHRERVAADAGLAAFPVLGRADVRAHLEGLRDPGRAPDTLRKETSGGSTGEPVALYQDDAYWSYDVATEAYVLRSWGLDPWCRSAFLWGSDQDVSDLPLRERMWMRLVGRLLINAFRMGDAELARAADDLERHRPLYVQGYASALALMAAWLLEHRPDHGIRPRAIRSSAEVLTPEVRALVERAFGARVYDFYGSRESASIAVECPAGRLHVQGHARVVELVDDAGRPTGPGTPGRLLVTDLTNRAFGLIRYETGDVSSWAEPADCPCGCPFPALERILGRTSDFITTPDGERLHGEWFTHLFYGRDGVARFQVYQPRLDRLEVRTVGPATEDDLADVLAAIRARVGARMTVAFETVASIPTTRSGKHRFTCSDVPFLPVAP